MAKKKCYTMQARVSANGGKCGEIDVTDEIGMWGITFNDFRDDLRALGDVESYQLNINSPGGSVFDAVAMCNFIKSMGKPITARILGYCASAATFFTSIADKVEMPANAFFLIHKPWNIVAGNADELRDCAEMLDKVEKSIMGMYLAKTKKSEEEISAWMKAGDWWTAAEAKEHGFIDEVTGALEAAACVTDLSGLGNVTESVKDLAAKDAKTGEEGDQKANQNLTWMQKMAALVRPSSGDAAASVSAKERADFEAKSAKLAEDMKALEEEKKQVEAMALEVKKRHDEINSEVSKKVAARVVDTVAALGIGETSLPAAEQSEQKMSEKELLALINGVDTPNGERRDAEMQLREMRKESPQK